MSCATVRVGASCMLFMVSTGRVVVGVVGRPRVFPVRMPAGKRYWTLLDDDLEPVVEADEFLRHLRFGRDAAESTTRTYAGAWNNSSPPPRFSSPRVTTISTPLATRTGNSWRSSITAKHDPAARS